MSEVQVLGKIAPFNIPKGYMVWLDRKTFEIKGQPFAKGGKKLDPAEVARRAKAKAAKSAAYEQRVADNAQKREDAKQEAQERKKQRRKAAIAKAEAKLAEIRAK